MKVLLQILNSSPPELPNYGGWSLEFRKLIADCLKKNPKERPTVDQLLKNHKGFFDLAKDHTYLKQNFLNILPPIDQRVEASLQKQGDDFKNKLEALSQKKKKTKWIVDDEPAESKPEQNNGKSENCPDGDCENVRKPTEKVTPACKGDGEGGDLFDDLEEDF